MNNGMTELTFDQAAEVSGGNIFALAISAYAALLDKIEANPDDYSWLMDWYYE